MENVKKVKELKVNVPDNVGALADVTEIISGCSVNIDNICAYGVGGEAIFYIVTADNLKIREVLEKKGCKTDEREVILLSLENRPGALLKVAEKLKEEHIDIKYIYGTTSSQGDRTNIVFSSVDNDRAVEVLKFVLSLSRWGR